MAQLARVKARWSGFTGAPGYSIFHFRDFAAGGSSSAPIDAAAAALAVTRVRTFFTAVAGLLPARVNILVEAEVEVVEDTTGALVTSFTTPATTSVQGTSNAVFSAAVGAVINWRTNGIRKRRRVRGRTFLVPLSAGAFADTGQMTSAAVATLTTAANALADQTTGIDLFVYGRPTVTGAEDGVAYVVSSAQVPAMGAVLTSRRD